MRRLFAFVITLALLLILAGCDKEEASNSGKMGTANEMEIVDWGQSALYTDDDISSAIDVVIASFEAEFKGCSLTQISYPGDDLSDLFDQWAKEYKSDEAIVLYSSFDTDSAGGDGSLNPNATYTKWQWILVRNGGGIWELATYGYG